MPRRYDRKPPERCYVCDVPIPWNRRRRNRKYCSNACKQAIYRVRRHIKLRALGMV